MLLGNIILFMLAASALLGILEYYRDVNRIRSCAKYFRSLSNKYILARVIFILTLLLGLGVWSKIASLTAIIIVVLLISLLTGGLTVLEYRKLVAYKFTNKFKKLIGVCGGICALFLTVGIDILVDSEISGLTGLATAELPNAQRLYFLFFGVIFISLAALIILMIAYFFQAAFLLFNMVRSTQYIDGVYGAISVIFGVKRIKRIDEYLALAIFLGMMISAYSLSLALQNVLSEDWLKNQIRSYLIFSSYHDVPKYCSNLDAETSKVAFLRGGKVSVALFQDDGTILFYPGSCVRPTLIKQKKS